MQQDPARPALSDAHCTLTHGELADEVRRVAGGLAALGVGPGDVVATMLPNRVELATVMFAAWHLRAALTPINPALTIHEAAHQLGDSGAALVVVDDASAALLTGLGATDLPTSRPVRRLHVDELERSHMAPPEHTPLDTDLALLIYTGGTTGRPKGVLLDHANVHSMVKMLVRHLRVTEADRALVALPLFHVNGLVVSLLLPLAVGGSAVLLERFSLTTFWAEVQRVRPTYFSLVPAMYLMFNALPPEVRPDTSSLRFCICGAAPMPPDALTTFGSRYGSPIIEAYGLSETTVGVAVNPLDGPIKAGSVGPALEGLAIRTVDADDHSTACGEPGEVVVRGPNVMRGYLGKPEETARAIRAGWLHTGDVGHLDEDGYLFLRGRTKDLIIRGGENLYPAEIENAIMGHPAVAEAAVVGRPDAVLGEVPVAFVCLVEGAVSTDAELLEHLRERLTRTKIPTEVHIVHNLPRTPVGKVATPELRRRVSS
ncbi:AMP-binding protein [Klenkia sp. LSe6-5]|uniref:AMP-binding protein n=1 Tax=Klenkia sesuvii TaxID=3103137 RepID=A0ABU8DZF6_9ACTN